MNNAEFYKKELEEIKGMFTMVNGEITSCGECKCVGCDFKNVKHCFDLRIKWLCAEHIEQPKLIKPITLHDFLLYRTNACDYVAITSGGWQIGFTFIDYEDLFIHSLDKTMLNKIVKEAKYKNDEDINKPVLYVEIKD